MSVFALLNDNLLDPTALDPYWKEHLNMHNRTRVLSIARTGDLLLLLSLLATDPEKAAKTCKWEQDIEKLWPIGVSFIDHTVLFSSNGPLKGRENEFKSIWVYGGEPALSCGVYAVQKQEYKASYYPHPHPDFERILVLSHGFDITEFVSKDDINKLENYYIDKIADYWRKLGIS